MRKIKLRCVSTCTQNTVPKTNCTEYVYISCLVGATQRQFATTNVQETTARLLNIPLSKNVTLGTKVLNWNM